MEEANERIVKLFLENRGFLVKTSQRVKIRKNLFLEADIIALRPVNRNDGIPNKIIGEVKSWPVKPKNFRKLIKKGEKPYFKSFKYLNNEGYKKIFKDKIEEKFGKGFKFAIFSRPPANKHKERLDNFFKKEDIFYLDHITLLNNLIKELDEYSYSNDPELQILRLLKRFGKI